jgi:hypothetical protein
MATTKEAQGIQEDLTSEASPEPAEGLVFEADYEEDRPISMLAERQREFQRTMQSHSVGTEMPAA